MRIRRSALAAVCLAAALSACGGSDSEERDAVGAEPPTVSIPTRLLGLDVVREEIGASTLAEGADQPFVNSVGLFAFREKRDLLQGTLQISRFTSEARPEEGGFRGAIISRIGGTNPRRMRAGEQDIFVTTGRNQNVFIWFKKEGFFVLTVRNDYEFPRTLLRKILDLDIEL